MSRVDFFYRRYNRDRVRMFSPRNVVCVSVEASGDLAALLRAGYAAARKAPFDRATGIFEVQTDAGIWRSADERALDPRTATGRARAVFKTWAELEAEELAP